MPWFRLSDPAVTQMLTVGDLYSHRSGLPAAEGDLLEDLGYDRRYILEHLALAPLSPFRISYAYANYGMTAGAEAVAESLGESWEDLSEEYLYAPLGMTSTSSRFSDLESRTNRAAQHALTEEGAFAPLYTREPDAQSPAGGVSSSVNDLAKWMALILADGGDLISADALLPAVTPQVVSAPAGDPATRTGFYGYGWNVSVQPGGRVQLGHSGAFLLGTGTNVAMIPSLDVGITVLTNAAPIGAAEAIAASFLDIVQYGSITRDWYEAYHGAFGHYFETSTDLAGKTRPDGPLPDVQRDLGPLFGTYQNDYYGPIQVGWQGDGAGTAGNVIVGMGPGFETQFVLEHWSGDTFALEPGGENALPGDLSSVVFDVGQDGHGTVTIQYFDRWPGQGVWTR
jgi:CubicO group peptidase (beta-lactamase class C family)